jgi:predicted DCC family thiol-disulfide oxidoreductase YuxK
VRSSAFAVLFYDGGCGLCHFSIRALLALDRRGALRFAPLGGDAFRELVPAAEADTLPDSLVLRTTDGRLLVRSAALLECLRLIGGPAKALAGLARFVPRPIADRLYDGLARVRARLFAAPRGACPSVSPARRDRFL